MEERRTDVEDVEGVDDETEAEGSEEEARDTAEGEKARERDTPGVAEETKDARDVSRVRARAGSRGEAAVRRSWNAP